MKRQISLRWRMPDFFNHLVCLNPFLQLTVSSHSDRPPFNQQPPERTTSCTALCHFTQLHHNTEENTSVSFFQRTFFLISYDLGVWNISWLLSRELLSYPSVSVQICVNPSLSAATWVRCLGISAVSIVRSFVDTSKPDEGSLGLYKAWTLKTFKERFTPFLHQITDFIQMKSFRQLIHNCTATVNLCCLLKKQQLMGLEQSEDE